MRHIVILIIFLLCAVSFAETQNKARQDILTAFNYNNANFNYQLDKKQEEKRSGCCSHHGGVCGCSSGRAMCCDGTLSPSCGCD